MIVTGKLNMDEFAMGGSSETGFYGPVRNPRDPARVAGGSSGGSAAAVAGREVPLSLGSDTGGSIRQPCAFCGVTGIKPTYGAVSRYGLIAYASSLDQIGPIGRDINDCAALLEIISGPDANDSTCVIEKPFDFGKGHTGRLDGITGSRLKIGLPRNYFGAGIDDDVRRAVLEAARELESAGAHVEEFDMPLMDCMIPAYYIIATAEASSNLSRYDGVKYGYRAEAGDLTSLYSLTRAEGFGKEVIKRILLGTFVLSSGFYDAYYKKALQVKSLIRKQFNEIFYKYDAILSPVAPTTAPRLGESTDALKMYLSDIFTVSANLAGLPAISVPFGKDSNGMPIGVQLIGNRMNDNLILTLGGSLT
jgi:aspartyl-tRNA(Asn)/glutamyl-tRNA(Gln) amidotransferase subunit A